MPDIKATMGLDASGVKTGLNDAMGQVSGFASKVAGAFGVGLGLGALKGVVETTAQLGDMAEQTGLTVRQVQVLQNVSNAAGTDFNKTSESIKRIVQALGEAKAGGSSLALFEKMGLSFKQIQTMGTDETIKAVGAAFSKATPGTAEYSNLMDIIGTRSGPKAVTALREFASVLGDVNKESASGPIISDESVENAQLLSASMKSMATNASAIAASMLGAFVKGVGEVGVGVGADETEKGAQARSLREMKMRDAANKADRDAKAAALAAVKEFTPQQEKELAALRAKAQSSYEQLLSLQEQSDLQDGLVTHEQLLLRIQNEKLRIAEKLKALEGRGDFAAESRKLVLAEQQDKLTAKEFGIKKDIATENKKALDDAIAAADQRAKYLDDLATKEEQIRTRASEDVVKIQKNTSVSPLQGDQMSRIGGSIGGQISPQLTVAMRQLKIEEAILEVNKQAKASIDKLRMEGAGYAQ